MSRFTNAASPAALIISAMALTVSLSAGGAYAATLIGTGQLKNSSVTSAKIKDKTITTKDLSSAAKKALTGATGAAGAPGATGPAGATGATGATGAPGTSATSLWAVIKSSAVLARGSGTDGAVSFSTGTYIVGFDRNIASCAYAVTVGSDGSAATGPGYATVRTATSNVAAITVHTFNKDGDATNLPFHLTVFC